MARVARIVLPGLPHHVTHRGNHRSSIFFKPRDRRRYLRLLAHYAAQHQLAIWAYCLMTNHVHLLVVPSTESSMASAIGRAHMMYARLVNRRNRWTGHLWANRYYSAPVEQEEAAIVARYIELNPVRAGIAPKPEAYPWSSARAHCLQTQNPILDADRQLARDPLRWRAWLSEIPESQEIENIRRSTSTGTPLGSKEFLADLERTLGRRLTRRRYGRRERP